MFCVLQFFSISFEYSIEICSYFRYNREITIIALSYTLHDKYYSCKATRRGRGILVNLNKYYAK